MIGDEPASTYTRAKLFQEKGKKTPLAIRFSTVIGGRDSSEVARDPRGFAVKFYTKMATGIWSVTTSRSSLSAMPSSSPMSSIRSSLTR